jgi:hypothetical protein
MKKEILTHFVVYIAFFALLTLVQGRFELELFLFWLGGLIGTALPDVDHVVYVYFLRPEEFNSQRVQHMNVNRNFTESFKYLAETRSERTKLIFHTFYFQLIFYALSFLILSSGNLFGRGLVLAFLLHLLIDQFIDYRITGSINNWFRDLPVMQDDISKQKLYLIAVSILFLLFAFLL